MNYDLNGLNPIEFEHLIQSLLKKIIGQGTITFGQGPDGGREATYEGTYTHLFCTCVCQPSVVGVVVVGSVGVVGGIICSCHVLLVLMKPKLSPFIDECM